MSCSHHPVDKAIKKSSTINYVSINLLCGKAFVLQNSSIRVIKTIQSVPFNLHYKTIIMMFIVKPFNP